MFIAPSLTPFCFGAGALTVALSAFLAAVYLTLEARENQLREDFRRRALSAAFVVFAAAAGTLALALTEAPLMGRGLTATPWALPLHLTTGAGGRGGNLYSMEAALCPGARGCRGPSLPHPLGWGLAQYPYLFSPTLTIADAAAPNVTLTLIVWTLTGGALLLFPSLIYLFRIFKRQR